MLKTLKNDIMAKANKYFNVDELVSKEVYELLGDNAIKLIDTRLLKVIEEIRELLGVPLICNNWMHGGSRNNCGYRDLNCTIGASKSAHKDGMAADLISVKMSAADMRKKILANKDKISYPIRIEDDVTWLHVDVRNTKNDSIYLFKA